MRYELLLQAPVGETFDLASAEEALAALHPLQGETPRRWSLPAGDVEARPVREGPRTVALEFGIMLTQSDAEARALVQELTAAARGRGLVVVDPQLNQIITAADEEAVAEKFRGNARYVADHAGIPGLTGLGVVPEAPKIQLTGRVILSIIGVVFLLLMLSNTCSRVLSATR